MSDDKTWNTLMILIGVIIFLVVEYFFTKIIFIISFSFTILAIFVWLMVHILLMRYLSRSLLFIGGFKPFFIYMKYNYNKYFSREFENFGLTTVNYLNDLRTNTNLRQNIYDYYSILNSYWNKIVKELQTLNKMKEIDRLSKSQEEFRINVSLFSILDLRFNKVN